MKVKILTIKPTNTERIFDVAVLIGSQQHNFSVTIELDTIANQEIQIINGDESFSETFRFNQRIASDICQLVAKFHNHQTVNLPIEIGDFYADKLELMKV